MKQCQKDSGKCLSGSLSGVIAVGLLSAVLVQPVLAQGGGGGPHMGGGQGKREHVMDAEELRIREKQRAKGQQQSRERQQVENQQQQGGQGKAAGEQVQQQAHARDRIYGEHLMTEQERNMHQERIRAAKSDKERDQIRAEHRKMIQERAQKQGVDVPAE